VKEMKKRIPKRTRVFLTTFPFFSSYYILLMMGSLAETFLSKKIKNEKELQGIINEEADRLGMGSKNLIGTLVPYRKSTSSVWYFDIEDEKNPRMICKEQINGKKILQIKEVRVGGSQATRAHARHEVYHLAKGHCENADSGYRDNIRYLFFEEPCAILYSLGRL
jgi:hypothetical protein